MSPERWERLQELFHELSDLPPEEREARLDELDDASLRREVEALLAADADPPEVLKADVGALSQLLDEPIAEVGEASVGPYRLVEEVGAGGMGAVYRAEHPELDRTVALKLMRMPFASPEHVRRFLVERRILARLDHPSIARLLDAGSTRHGIPYFAMELVDGEPITDHADRHSLSIDDRLRLVAEVADAVAYAHRNLVVHRDLKPSNVLVTADRQVKLLDFGVAKLIAEVDDPEATRTRTGHLLFTPAYAAPEQIRGGDVTTATDVYALGMMLYELLTGERPYDVQGASPAGIERIVCDTVPLPPSRIVGRGEAAQAVAARRSTTPEGLQRALAGDLDTIVRTALAKEPERRYASAADLVADLRRYLEDLPIAARPSTPGYRLRKFFARNRTGVCIAVGTVLLVAALVGVYTYQLRQERDRAQAAVERAEREAATSEQIATFVTNLFEAANPHVAAGDTLTSYDLLDRGVTQVSTLSSDPVVQGRLLTAMGRSFSVMGAHARADSIFGQALDALQSTPAASDADFAKVYSYRAWLRYQQGRLPASDSLYRLALRHRQAHNPLPTSVFASDLSDRGFVLAELGRHDAADSLHQRALTLQRKLLGPLDPQVAVSLNNLGLLRHRTGHYAEADSFYRSALSIYADANLDETLDAAKTWNNLGLALQRDGRLAEADSAYRRSLNTYRAVVGDGHPLTAQAMNNLGGLLRIRGQYAEAERHYRRALEIWTATVGQDHPDVAASLNSIGLLLLQTAPERLNEGEALLRRALAINERAYGTRHGTVAGNLNNLALLLRKRERYEEAFALQNRVLDIDRSLVGDAHPYVAGDYRNLGYIRALQNRHADALPLYEKALAIQMDAFSNDHHVTHLTRRLLGASLVRLSRYADAEPLLLTSYEGLRDVLGDDHKETARSRTALVDLYEAWNRPDAAARYR
jgi:serine/threonine-protein kinase